MKIAFLSRYQNRIQRGAETFVFNLSSRLAKNHQVDILVGRDSDSIKKILDGRYEVVISMNGGMQALKASTGRIIGRYKLVVIGEAGIGKVAIWNTAIVWPDVFVAITDYMAKWIKKWAWNSRVVKINNGVDLKRFTREGEKIKINLKSPVILSVGALEWYKHHKLTIEAVSLLNNVSLLIVGEGKEKENLEQLGRIKLGDRFKILKAGYEDLPKIYRSVDVFVLPSWDREAFGIVYIEAMASGLPVVAPDDPPRREIVGEAGILTNVEDIKEYANAINECLNLKWDDKPRKQADKFSWEKIVPQYEELISQL